MTDIERAALVVILARAIACKDRPDKAHLWEASAAIRAIEAAGWAITPPQG